MALGMQRQKIARFSFPSTGPRRSEDRNRRRTATTIQHHEIQIRQASQSGSRDQDRVIESARSPTREPGGAGRPPGPVSSAEILEATDPHLVAGSSGHAVCDSAWSGKGAPAPPGTQTTGPGGESAAGGPTSFRDTGAASRRPAPVRWTRRAPAAATLRAAAEARASAPSPRAWRARPAGRGSPRSGIPP